MGGTQQPFMYDAVRTSRFPEKEFDPKAVTRASWEPRPKRTKPKGPFVSFNRHPDALQVPSGRTTTFRPMSGTTKWWVRWSRYLQLGLRSVELVAGLGLVALMILISNVQPELVWVMRIVPGVVAASCVYSIYHHARPARARPPLSSAAYQLFSGAHDLATVGLYTVGAVLVHSHGAGWATLLPVEQGPGSDDLVQAFLVPAEYYTLIAAAGLHLASLGVDAWLGWVFYRIAQMPPDQNPLEDHLTRRSAAHKRNKSSVATTATWESVDSSASSSSTARIAARLEEHRRSGAAYEDLSRPPSIPFMHTRTGSKDSLVSPSSSSPSSPASRRGDLPSRQYQIVPGNRSPTRSSIVTTTTTTPANAKRRSAPAPARQRGQYTEVPISDSDASPAPLFASSRPASIASMQTLRNKNPAATTSPTAATAATNNNNNHKRPPRFTETWYASDSLLNRTQERLRAMKQEQEKGGQQQQVPPVPPLPKKSQNNRVYEAITQRFDDEEGGYGNDSDSDRENTMMSPRRYEFSDYSDDDDEGKQHLFPDPLRAHPPTKQAQQQQQQRPHAKTPFRSALTPAAPAALSEVNANARSVSGSQDIAADGVGKLTVPKAGGRGGGAEGRNRDSSIQSEEAFCYSRPYGELKAATPPILVGKLGGGNGGARQVSSGHDYDLNGAGNGNGGYGPRSYRRNVSGKAAEEGRAGPDGAASRTILKGFMASVPS